jgi:hypothetical protein
MMLNKLPEHAHLSSVLVFLEMSGRWGARNRALFAVRQHLRIKDICWMLVSDVVNPDASIRNYFVSREGRVFALADEVREEIRRYLMIRFPRSVEAGRFAILDLRQSLFPTQKRCGFSPNTLAQHFSHLDRLVVTGFQANREIVVSRHPWPNRAFMPLIEIWNAARQRTAWNSRTRR